MKLVFELGKTYTVEKVDGFIITFKFIGGEPACGEIDGKAMTIDEILQGGYTSYYETV